MRRDDDKEEDIITERLKLDGCKKHKLVFERGTGCGRCRKEREAHLPWVVKKRKRKTLS